MVKFARTDSLDLIELADNLRPHDAAELSAVHGDVDPLDVLQLSSQTSAEVWTASGDDGLWCVFGVAPLGGTLLTPIAAPWQLGTPTMNAHPSALIRETRHYLAEVRERYPMLVNFVDARNTPSLRYLKAVGFTIDEEPQPYGVAQLPFHRFHMGL